MRFPLLIVAALAFSTSFVFGDEPPPAQPKKEAADAAKSQVSAKITVGKDTTYVTGPLREDGTVNFLEALNEHASRGVTPENNGAIPFWRIVGSEPVEANARERYFKKLGMEVPPEGGEYFISFSNYLDLVQAGKAPGTEQLADKDPDRAQEKRSEVEDQQIAAMQRNWSAEEFPILAAWLARNDKQLDQLAMATKRARFYSPYVGGDQETEALVAVFVPDAQPAREVARALTCRANLRSGSGKLAEAQADLLACHRLARSIAEGETLIESLVGIAIDGIAQQGDRVLASSNKVSADELRAYAAQLRALPPLSPMIERLDFGERLMFVDCTTMVARMGSKALAMWGAETPVSSLLDNALNAGVDWDAVLRTGNGWYDRLVAAGRETDYAKQKAALSEVDVDLRKLSKDAGDLKSFTVLSLTKGLKEALTERTGAIMISLLLPATGAALDAEHRALVDAELTQFAFGLAVYRAEHDEYPAELDTLKPKYLDAIPIDRFSGKPFHYSATKDGYVLYSVGRNGEDDGGIGYRDVSEKPGDDLVVRVGKTK